MGDSWKRALVKKAILHTRTSGLIRRLYPFAISVSFNEGIRVRLDEVRRFLKIDHYKSLELIRVGDNFDGGYVVGSMLGRDLKCVSVGAGTNISFDLAISKFVDVVHLYDHTITNLPSPLQSDTNIHFFRNGLGALKENEFVTLQDCFDKFPAESQIILKMDIEGDEWEVFSSIERDLLFRCQQIVVEFHNLLQLNSVAFYEKVLASFENLAFSHSPVNVHPNNWGKVELISGVLVPDVLEITYIRKDLLGSKISNKSESKLNFPCNPHGNEIELIFS